MGDGVLELSFFARLPTEKFIPPTPVDLVLGEAAAYTKLCAQRSKESREKRNEKMSQRKSQRSSQADK